MKIGLRGSDAKQLWEQYRIGNIHALANIMQTYYQDLFHWGLRFYDEKEFVKDSIQEVFLNLWKIHGSIGEVENVKGYLMMVLKSHILRQLTNKVEMHQTDIDEDYTFSVEFSADLRMIEEEHQMYQTRTLERVLNTLPKRQKELVYLRFYQNMDFEEIAEVMKLGRQSAYNLFQKSMNSLRKNWPVMLQFMLLAYHSTK